MGVPDGRLGEAVAAVVSLRPGLCGRDEDTREVVTEESLIEQVRGR